MKSKISFFRYLSDSWHSLVSDYREFKEGPLPKEKILISFRQASLPAFGYYFMLAMSTLIATLGLIGNSAATIIGAMIISPLMNPIITLSFGITTRNRKLIDRGCLMLLTGVPLIILVSYFTSNLIGIKTIGSEVISRSHPTYLDLGVALGAGTAAAFAYSRHSISSSLPGVAIAVALVPPLCVVGIGIHAGTLGKYIAAGSGIDEHMSPGALTLFLTNLWGILFASVLVFICQKYGEWKKVLSGLVISFLLLLTVMHPLGEGFYIMYIREQFYRELLRLGADQRKFSEIDFREMNVRLLRDKYRIQLSFFSNVERINEESMQQLKKRIDTASERLSKKLGHPVLIEANVIPMHYIRSEKTVENKT